MRAKPWLAAVVVMGGLVLVSAPAFGAYPGGPWGGGWAAYGAPACGGPGYGAMVPGCCEFRPNCCDHVWDGYCQNRGCHKKHGVGCGTCGGLPCRGCQVGGFAPVMPSAPVPALPAPGSALEMFEQPPAAAPVVGAELQPTVAPAKPADAAPAVKK